MNSAEQDDNDQLVSLLKNDSKKSQSKIKEIPRSLKTPTKLQGYFAEYLTRIQDFESVKYLSYINHQKSKIEFYGRLSKNLFDELKRIKDGNAMMKPNESHMIEELKDENEMLKI